MLVERSMLAAQGAVRLMPAFRSAIGVERRRYSDRPTDIDLDELKKRIEKKNVLLIDVREPSELQSFGVLPGAINIPLGEIPSAMKLSPDAFERRYGVKFEPEKLVFTCKKGIRSETARQAAEKEGYDKARNFLGGFDRWSAAHEGGNN